MRTTSCGPCARAEAKGDRLGPAGGRAGRRPRLGRCLLWNSTTRGFGSEEPTGQAADAASTEHARNGRLGHRCLHDFRCFSNARVHPLEQWLRLPKLPGLEEGCAVLPTGREKEFLRAAQRRRLSVRYFSRTRNTETFSRRTRAPPNCRVSGWLLLSNCTLRRMPACLHDDQAQLGRPVLIVKL